MSRLGWLASPLPATFLRVRTPSGGLAVKLTLVLRARRRPSGSVAAADALVPSDMEGLPVAVLEALSAGLPVVASAVGGVATFGGSFELASPGSGAELRAGLERVLGDARRREEMASEGRTLIDRRFRPERMIESDDQLWERYSGRGVPECNDSATVSLNVI